MKFYLFLIILLSGCRASSWEYVKPKKENLPPIIDPGDQDPPNEDPDDPNPPDPKPEPDDPNPDDPNPDDPNPDDPNPPDPKPEPDPNPNPGPNQDPQDKCDPNKYPPLPPDIEIEGSICFCPYDCWFMCKVYWWKTGWRDCTPEIYWYAIE